METLWDILGTVALMFVAFAVGVTSGRRERASKAESRLADDPVIVAAKTEYETIRAVRKAFVRGDFDAEIGRAVIRNTQRNR